jgi:hypothetical protein
LPAPALLARLPCLASPALPPQASETFLQRMMSLYVASHYKNSPNDLILMSDAPAHHLFALLGPVDETQNALPDVLAVVQVALEGEISKRSAQASLAAGQLPQVRLPPLPLGETSHRSRRWGGKPPLGEEAAAAAAAVACLRCFQAGLWAPSSWTPSAASSSPCPCPCHTPHTHTRPLPSPSCPFCACFCCRET